MKRNTPNHPKTLWLKAGLGISKREVVGLLEMLFHFTATCSPQGDIGKWSNEQIAEALEWSGNADELVEHIVDAGYFDRDKTHRLVVHDWSEHADGAVKKHLQRSGLQFVIPAKHVPTKSGQRRTLSGQRRPAVAVALPLPARPENEQIPPPTDAAPPVAIVAPWNREAAELWRHEYKGDPPKAYFAALKPLVKREGWERVRPALVTYMAETPIDYVNIGGKFGPGFGTWEERARGAPRSPPSKQSVGDRTVAAMVAFSEAGRDNESGILDGLRQISSGSASDVGRSDLDRLPRGDGRGSGA